MKRHISCSLFLMVAILMFGLAVSQEKVVKIDLTGTWAGPAYTPDGEDIITCVIKHEGKKITGTVTDELGYINDAPINSASLSEDKLYMETTVSTPDGDFTLVMKGTIKGDTLEGEWEIPDTGDYGEWKAEKKVEKKVEKKEKK